ncbi:MAG: AmmeMemoRadiSam system protein A [Cellvibrionaceae bacterium]
MQSTKSESTPLTTKPPSKSLLSTHLESPATQQQLIALARDAIHYRVKTGNSFKVESSDYPPALQEQGCCFVTLHKQGKLRGCIGALEPYTSLLQDIVNHAQSAAVGDPRFPPVTPHELSELDIDISVLTPQEPIEANGEDDLLNQLVASKDGLTIDDGHHRATFLPSVWEQLPSKEEFLLHLKRKAGLRDHEWPSTMKCWRYHTLMIS